MLKTRKRMQFQQSNNIVLSGLHKMFGCIQHSLQIVTGRFHLVIQSPHDPFYQPCFCHPVVECLDILVLLQHCHFLKGKEDLMNMKTKEILVDELSEHMSVLLRHVTYPIFKGHAWCSLTSSSRWYRGIMMVKSSDAGIPTRDNMDVHRWGIGGGPKTQTLCSIHSSVKLACRIGLGSSSPKGLGRPCWLALLCLGPLLPHGWHLGGWEGLHLCRGPLFHSLSADVKFLYWCIALAL